MKNKITDNDSSLTHTCPPRKKSKLIADSGSFGHYLNPGDAKYLTRIEEDVSVTVSMPNDMTMTSSLSGDLILNTIPMEARKAHVFNEITSWSLLSLGVLCDAGCEATLTKNKLIVKMFDEVVLNGYRDHTTSGMWMVDLTENKPMLNAARPIEPINNIYPTGTIAKLVAFYHGCACSTPISSFLRILELGTVLPGITKKDILKYPPITAATAAGHLDGTRFVRFRPNCKLSSSTLVGSEGEPPPLEKNPLTGEHSIVAFQLEIEDDRNMGDLTGKFPDKLATASGNSYLLVMVSTKTNYIHIEPLRDRQGSTIATAYERGIIFYEKRGVKTKYERLDNETSIAFSRMCARRDIIIEYVPPGQHRANIS